MENLSEMIKVVTSEQVGKVKTCKTAEEILKMAKLEGFGITMEQAGEIFKILTPIKGELSDQELDNIAGGSDKEGAKCPRCGSTNVGPFGFDGISSRCNGCGNIFI